MVFDKMMHERPYSDDTAREIDNEVEVLIKEAAHRAEVVLKANTESLSKLKDRLIEQETLEAEAVIGILKGSKLPQPAKLY
jgi:cell division protease FtsH